MRKQNYLVILFSLAPFLYGCQGSSENSADTGAPTVETTDDTTITQPITDTLGQAESVCIEVPEEQSNCMIYAQNLFDSISTHRYRSQASIKVNKGNPYPSDITDNKYIDVYIDREYDEYLQIDPDTEFSSIEVDSGTTIIREVWGEDNELENYTVMIKMEAGYFPEGGDFLYAVLQHDGAVLRGGRLENCAECHQSRENDGFLFGVSGALKEGDADQQEADTYLASLARAVVADKTYLEKVEFFPVNITPYPSELNPDNYLKVYVSQFSSLNYMTVHRDRENSGARVPEETVIVREVQDVGGNVKNITVMVKGANGYYPEGGDFFYGVYDIDGHAIIDNGKTMEGRLQECGSCHINLRKGDGFLFGISSENRN